MSLIDHFFSGNYPDSPAAISVNAGWFALLLQTMMFLLPGVFVDVDAVTKWHQMPGETTDLDEQLAVQLAKEEQSALEGGSISGAPPLGRKTRSWKTAAKKRSTVNLFRNIPASEDEEPEDWAVSGTHPEEIDLVAGMAEDYISFRWDGRDPNPRARSHMASLGELSVIRTYAPGATRA